MICHEKKKDVVPLVHLGLQQGDTSSHALCIECCAAYGGSTCPFCRQPIAITQHPCGTGNRASVATRTERVQPALNRAEAAGAGLRGRSTQPRRGLRAESQPRVRRRATSARGGADPDMDRGVDPDTDRGADPNTDPFVFFSSRAVSRRREALADSSDQRDSTPFDERLRRMKEEALRSRRAEEGIDEPSAEAGGTYDTPEDEAWQYNAVEWLDRLSAVEFSRILSQGRWSQAATGSTAPDASGSSALTLAEFRARRKQTLQQQQTGLGGLGGPGRQ